MRPQRLQRGSALALLLLIGPSSGVIAQEQETLVLPRLNRDYVAVVEELAPIEVGVARIRLRSPEHVLELLSNRARLRRLPDGSFFANLELSFRASGLIEADVELGKIKSQLSDSLVAPEQRVRLAGRIQIAPASGGYLITALEIPDSIEVHIESQLAGQLFVLCRQMALVLVNLQCAELERSLTYLQVPLPAAGEEFFLPIEELTEENRRQLSALLKP